MMETNYYAVVFVLVVAVLLIVFLIKRNRKDQKNFEKNIINSEMKPEKHEEGNLEDTSN